MGELHASRGNKRTHVGDIEKGIRLSRFTVYRSVTLWFTLAFRNDSLPIAARCSSAHILLRFFLVL